MRGFPARISQIRFSADVRQLQSGRLRVLGRRMLACSFNLLPSAVRESCRPLQNNTDQQQRLVVSLRAVVFDIAHDELPELLEWSSCVLNQQVLKASEAKLFILRIGYFGNPIGQQQEQIPRIVGD